MKKRTEVYDKTGLIESFDTEVEDEKPSVEQVMRVLDAANQARVITAFPVMKTAAKEGFPMPTTPLEEM